jgi:flagellar biosynthetic protein FliR
VQAPQLTHRTSALAALQTQFVLVVFLSLDGHLLFLRGLADSLQAIPVTVFPAAAGGFLQSAIELGRVTGRMMAAALQMSAPALLALFLVDLTLGLLQRTARGGHLYEDVSAPLKLMVGIGMVLLGTGLFLEQILNLFRELLASGARFLRV